LSFAVAVAVVAGGFPVVFAASPARAAVTDLYVDRTVTSCSDSGSGTATAPYCTLTKGVAALKAGYTLYVGNGVYNETIRPAVSGTSTAPVTITRWAGRSPTIGVGMTNGVNLSSRSYVTVSRVTIANTVADGIYVSSSNNVTISGNTVKGAGQPASGRTAPGISLRGTNRSTVSGNTADQNHGHGILLTSASTGNTVAGNEASLNAEAWRRNANGIDVISPGNTVIGNVTHDNEDSGINFYTGGNDNLAVNNVTYNNGDHGIDNYNVTGGRLIGNTVFHNCTTGINVEGTSGSYTVVNNVAVDNAVYPAYNGISCSRRAGNIGIWDSAPSSTHVDHNLVWLSKPGTMYVFKSGYSSLAPMQAATGQEADGVQGDPWFVDSAQGDLRLTEGSPALDRADSGTSGAQATDILGKPRVDDPNVPNTHAGGPRRYDDIGAYEFQPSSAPGPSAPSAVLSVSPASGVAPLAMSADASGSSDPQGQALSFVFDFGDGTAVGPQAGATASHTYATSGTFTVKVTATNTSGLSSSATRSVTVSSGVPQTAPAYVNQIATNYSTSSKTTGYITVWRTGGVQAGDLVVLTLQLAGTPATGAVSGTDTSGNSYTVAGSIADGAGNRLVVLTGVASAALPPGGKVTVAFPSSTGGYRLVGDEFAGVTGVDATAAAAGTTSGFSSGPASTSAAREVVFGVVMSAGAGGAPSWGSGWKDLGGYAVGTTYLGRAYQLPTTAGTFNASGTTTGSWLAATVALRP
jgi:parallel beta-helix repeat protein